MKLPLALCFTATLLAQTWAPQTSNTRASLRGVSAVDARSAGILCPPNTPSDAGDGR